LWRQYKIEDFFAGLGNAGIKRNSRMDAQGVVVFESHD